VTPALDPVASKITLFVAPEIEGFVGENVKLAEIAAGVTVTVFDVRFDCPRSFVTVNVTVYVLDREY
jgi:hypothetical protein